MINFHYSKAQEKMSAYSDNQMEGGKPVAQVFFLD
jgi:hypothetical protein